MKHILIKLTALTVAAAAAVSMSPRAEAKFVTWSSVQTITSNFDIQNPDSIVLAVDYGNTTGNHQRGGRLEHGDVCPGVGAVQ